MSITHAEYAAIDAVNISTLKAMWELSPLHYQHRIDSGGKDTKPKALGTATHMAMFEPMKFAGHYAVKPEGMNFANKIGKAWRAEHSHMPLITHSQHARCLAMRAAAEAHPFASKYLSGGEAEKALTWEDAETGVACKGRVDLLKSDGVLVGLKTAETADTRKWANQAARFGYHLQWAFYHDALKARGKRPPEVVEIVVESAEPHDVSVYIIGPDTIEVGREEYRDALVKVVQCREAKAWPGRHPEPIPFDLPRWAVPDDDDDMSGYSTEGLA